MLKIIEEIEDSRNWRTHELENLKKIGLLMLPQENQGIIDEFYRMCIPYIYAHWEGYVLETFKMLVDYINEQDLSYRQVNINLMTFSQLEIFKSLSGKQSFIQCIDFTTKYIELIENKCKIDRKKVSSKSNLRYKQLIEIFDCFGIKADISKYEKDVDSLVNQRNRIAHGEKGITVDYENIEEKINFVLNLFDEILIVVKDYVELKKYLNISCF